MRWLISVLVLVASACAGPAQSPNSSNPKDLVGDWDLVGGHTSGGPLLPIAAWPVTLEVENAISVGGIAGCNYYGAELVVAGAALNITPGPMTAMLCQRGDVMDLESRFIAALDTATSWSVDANRLVLGGPNVELAFNRTVPIDLSQIEGKEWVAVGLVPENGAVMPAVLGATLVLKNGSITGSTGCRTFAGTYMVNTGRFEVGSFAMDGECPQNGRGQDDHIVGVLGDGFSPQIADGNLVLSGRFATGLVYEPAAP